MIENLMEVLAAAGMEQLTELNRSDINQRVGSTVIKNYAEMYPHIKTGCLLHESTMPDHWKSAWARADANRW